MFTPGELCEPTGRGVTPLAKGQGEYGVGTLHSYTQTIFKKKFKIFILHIKQL